MRHHSLDRMPKAERDAILDRLRPESGRAVREVLNWWLDPFMTTSVGAGPLPVPGAGHRRRPRRGASRRPPCARPPSGSARHFRVMPGMSHWLIGEPGWEDVAERALAGWTAEARAPQPKRGRASAAQRIRPTSGDQGPGALHHRGRQVEVVGQQRPQDQAGADEVAEQRDRPLGVEPAQRRAGVGDQDDAGRRRGPRRPCRLDQNVRSWYCIVAMS